jgi:hypothetical protein
LIQSLSLFIAFNIFAIAEADAALRETFNFVSLATDIGNKIAIVCAKK